MPLLHSIKKSKHLILVTNGSWGRLRPECHVGQDSLTQSHKRVGDSPGARQLVRYKAVQCFSPGRGVMASTIHIRYFG